MPAPESNIQPCPAYRVTEVDKAQRLAQQQMSRRRFLHRAFYTTAALGAAQIGDGITNEILWPHEPTEISLVPGSEVLPKGGEEWVVFGGLGQQDSKKAATEFFTALGGNQVVSSIRYDNNGIDARSIAAVLARHIRERDVKRLSVVGVSMGMPTFMLAWSELERQTVKGYRDITQTTKLQRLVAYSSPFDVNDAWEEKAASLIAQSGYKGGVVGKYLMSLIDGPGDIYRTLPTNTPRELWDHLKETWHETTTTCPPRLYVSQLRLLKQADIYQRRGDFRNSFAEDAHFAYCAPTNPDTIVRDNNAESKYATLCRFLKLAHALIRVPNGGHANTLLSAKAIEPWLSSTHVII